ncbi:MAG: N-acetyltransferase family protein [Polyangiaceae bacterium]
MTTFHVRRSLGQDVEPLREVFALLAHDKGSLLTARREALDPASWLEDRVPLVVVCKGAQVVGFAGAVPDRQAYSSPRCAELLVGVVPKHRRLGAGRAAVLDLFARARGAGLWKLVGFAEPEDAATRALLARTDFREVGTLEKHVQREGAWRNVTVHERLLMSARRSNPAING